MSGEGHGATKPHTNNAVSVQRHLGHKNAARSLSVRPHHRHELRAVVDEV